MQRFGNGIIGDSSKAGDWARLGARILEATREAVRIHREEEGSLGRAAGAPFLRLVRSEDHDEALIELQEAGSAA